MMGREARATAFSPDSRASAGVRRAGVHATSLIGERQSSSSQSSSCMWW